MGSRDCLSLVKHDISPISAASLVYIHLPIIYIERCFFSSGSQDLFLLVLPPFIATMYYLYSDEDMGGDEYDDLHGEAYSKNGSLQSPCLLSVIQRRRLTPAAPVFAPAPLHPMYADRLGLAPNYPSRPEFQRYNSSTEPQGRSPMSDPSSSVRDMNTPIPDFHSPSPPPYYALNAFPNVRAIPPPPSYWGNAVIGFKEVPRRAHGWTGTSGPALLEPCFCRYSARNNRRKVICCTSNIMGREEDKKSGDRQETVLGADPKEQRRELKIECREPEVKTGPEPGKAENSTRQDVAETQPMSSRQGISQGTAEGPTTKYRASFVCGTGLVGNREAKGRERSAPKGVRQPSNAQANKKKTTESPTKSTPSRGSSPRTNTSHAAGVVGGPQNDETQGTKRRDRDALKSASQTSHAQATTKKTQASSAKAKPTQGPKAPANASRPGGAIAGTEQKEIQEADRRKKVVPKEAAQSSKTQANTEKPQESSAKPRASQDPTAPGKPSRSSDTNAGTQEKKVKCYICSTVVSSSKITSLPCEHQACRSCLTELFELSVKDPRYMLPRCPCSSAFIPSSAVEDYFGPKFKARWNVALNAYRRDRWKSSTSET